MTPRRAAPFIVLGSILALSVTVLVGCSSSAKNTSTRPAPTPTTSAPTSEAPVSTPAASSARPSTTAPTTSKASSPVVVSSPPPRATSSAPTAPAFTTTCTSLSVRVIPGGAVRGAEIAGIQFANDGSKPCVINGFPTAQLLRGGTAIGGRSTPLPAQAKPYTIAPGAIGESLLQDFSTCNAPLSESVMITMPSLSGSTPAPVVRPARLRACELRTPPVGAPS